MFKKIVRLWYHDGSSMTEHLNAFRLMNQTTPIYGRGHILSLFLLLLSFSLQFSGGGEQVEEQEATSHILLNASHVFFNS